MRRLDLSVCLAATFLTFASGAWAQPNFVNGLVIPGDALDATNQPGANAGRLGMFSDLYYDPIRDEWWALSDRGPGGGVLDYSTRVQRFTLNVDFVTGAISRFRVKDTIIFRDPDGLLSAPTAPVNRRRALNGLNPLGLNNDAGALGRSFDPEGLVIDPRTGHLIVADEYGPSVYEFDANGRLLHMFVIPENLIPKIDGVVNFVAIRDACAAPLLPPLCGLNGGRQDNRGFEGLAMSPDGSKLYAVLQDPLVNEGPHAANDPDNNGRNSRNLRIVVFDNDPDSSTYLTSIAQYVYQLEPQADIAARINALKPGNASGTDPRQGRNIGLSAITVINDHEFLVLERDNRGIGVDDPAGNNAVGSKRIYRIDIQGATNIATLDLPDDGNLADAGIVPVTKSGVVIDLAGSTLLPNGKLAEKWEGLTIGPKLKNGAHLILVGNDNDYSVTQNASSGEQFDVYVNFGGSFVRCVIDDPTKCEVDPATGDLTIDNPVPLPDGYFLIPGVLHAYKASKAVLAGYVEPGGQPN
jgi:hypothetical protein